ncbi:hypothetical protein M885DRAFT_533224 [Pelagophyceae sp. CCMP2097]|nr:hypothetical protein M885DRAFT_533224 [Pelagophyceae sp. CCMP2097]
MRWACAALWLRLGASLVAAPRRPAGRGHAAAAPTRGRGAALRGRGSALRWAAADSSGTTALPPYLEVFVGGGGRGDAASAAEMSSLGAASLAASPAAAAAARWLAGAPRVSAAVDAASALARLLLRRARATAVFILFRRLFFQPPAAIPEEAPSRTPMTDEEKTQFFKLVQHQYKTVPARLKQKAPGAAAAPRRTVVAVARAAAAAPSWYGSARYATNLALRPRRAAVEKEVREDEPTADGRKSAEPEFDGWGSLAFAQRRGDAGGDDAAVETAQEAASPSDIIASQPTEVVDAQPTEEIAAPEAIVLPLSEESFVAHVEARAAPQAHVEPPAATAVHAVVPAAVPDVAAVHAADELLALQKEVDELRLRNAALRAQVSRLEGQPGGAAAEAALEAALEATPGARPHDGVLAPELSLAAAEVTLEATPEATLEAQHDIDSGSLAPELSLAATDSARHADAEQPVALAGTGIAGQGIASPIQGGNIVSPIQSAALAPAALAPPPLKEGGRLLSKIDDLFLAIRQKMVLDQQARPPLPDAH